MTDCPYHHGVYNLVVRKATKHAITRQWDLCTWETIVVVPKFECGMEFSKNFMLKLERVIPFLLEKKFATMFH